MQFSVYPDPDNSGCDRVGLSLTLPQHGQQQQHEEQQQPPASSQASSKGGKRPQKAADDDLAANWLLSHSWGKYTGKRTPAGHRHATCSICLEHNHVSLTPVFCLTRIFDPRSYVGITSGKVSFEALLKNFCAKKAPKKLFEISDKSAYSAVMVKFLTFKKIMWALVKSEKKYWFSSCMGPHQEQLWCATTSHPPNGVCFFSHTVSHGHS